MKQGIYALIYEQNVIGRQIMSFDCYLAGGTVRELKGRKPAIKETNK